MLSDLATGAGRFLICQEARYASIATLGGDRIERRFVTPEAWRLFASAVRSGLEPWPGPADHVVSRMLTDEPQRKSRIVQYVSLQPLDFEVSSAAVRREGPQTPDEAISQNPRYEIGKRK